MEYTNWNWPQWVLVSYWGIGVGLAVILMASGVKLVYQKLAFRWIDIAALFTILYFGGFWA